jgi:hypothetical protein
VIKEESAACDKDGYAGFVLPAPPVGFTPGDFVVDLSLSNGTKSRASFTVLKDTSTPLPKISAFTASPSRITAGQPSTLKWTVTGSTRIEVLPGPVSAQPEGSAQVNPPADTSYTLYALNRGGCMYSTCIINVSPVVSEKADLKVIEFWSSGNVLAYRVRNSGNLASCPGISYLYKNDLVASKDYVAPLAPGEERVEAFQQYHFSPRFGSIMMSTGSEAATDAVNMRICVNAEDACAENDTTNNCIEHNFGPLLNVNLAGFVSTAKWQSSTASLRWPLLRDSKDGTASTGTIQGNNWTYPQAVLMSPPAGGGWIQGTFGLIKGTPPAPAPFHIPHKCKFSGKIGLTRDAPVSIGAKFLLGVVQDGQTTYSTPVTIDTPGIIQAYEVDLARFAGKTAFLILRVESGGPWQQGSAAWIEPALIQEY